MIWLFEVQAIEPRLCDGGYRRELLVQREPKVPKGCVRVSDQALASRYSKPVLDLPAASLVLATTSGTIGCKAHIILGFDAEHTAITTKRFVYLTREK